MDENKAVGAKVRKQKARSEGMEVSRTRPYELPLEYTLPPEMETRTLSSPESTVRFAERSLS